MTYNLFYMITISIKTYLPHFVLSQKRLTDKLPRKDLNLRYKIKCQILLKDRAFWWGVIFIIIRFSYSFTEKSPWRMTSYLILSYISEIWIGMALILSIMSFERISTRRVVSQFLWGVIKPLSLIHGIVTNIRVYVIHQRRIFHLVMIPIIKTFSSPNIHVRPYLRRYLWYMIYFQAVEAVLGLLFWHSCYF